MKLSYFLIALLGLSGCNDSSEVGPNANVTQAFTAKYPNATKVKWENKKSYLVAEFIYDQCSTKAWFDTQGEWQLTETDLPGKDQLPATVRDAFDNSEYVDWYIDEIDRLERPHTETIYVIEVKKEPQEYDLYYSNDGVLIKAVADEEEEYLPQPNPLPAAIQSWIDEKYPNARILEYDIERQQIEVDILYENRGQEVVFNLSYQWLNTHYDVRQHEVEEVVLQALAASAYGDYKIDDVEWYETPAQSYYLFELEKGNTEIKIKIDLNGQIQHS